MAIGITKKQGGIIPGETIIEAELRACNPQREEKGWCPNDMTNEIEITILQILLLLLMKLIIITQIFTNYFKAQILNIFNFYS